MAICQGSAWWQSALSLTSSSAWTCHPPFFLLLTHCREISGAQGGLIAMNPGTLVFFLSFSIYCQTLFRVLSAGVLCTLWIAGWKPTSNHIEIIVGFFNRHKGWLSLHRGHPVNFLSFSIYCLALAFEHYRQVYIVHSGLQDESLQVTISKLP